MVWLIFSSMCHGRVTSPWFINLIILLIQSFLPMRSESGPVFGIFTSGFLWDQRPTAKSNTTGADNVAGPQPEASSVRPTAETAEVQQQAVFVGSAGIPKDVEQHIACLRAFVI